MSLAIWLSMLLEHPIKTCYFVPSQMGGDQSVWKWDPGAWQWAGRNSSWKDCRNCFKKAKEELESNTIHPQAWNWKHCPENLWRKSRQKGISTSLNYPQQRGNLTGRSLASQKNCPRPGNTATMFCSIRSNVGPLTTKQCAWNDGYSDHYSQGQPKI